MKAGIAILCLFLCGCDQIKKESSQPEPSQRFQLAVDATGNAWRWNTVTGETWRCWQGNPVNARPTCYPMYLGQPN